jgi:hypothetical protein
MKRPSIWKQFIQAAVLTVAIAVTAGCAPGMNKKAAADFAPDTGTSDLLPAKKLSENQIHDVAEATGKSAVSEEIADKIGVRPANPQADKDKFEAELQKKKTEIETHEKKVVLWLKGERRRAEAQLKNAEAAGDVAAQEAIRRKIRGIESGEKKANIRAKVEIKVLGEKEKAEALEAAKKAVQEAAAVPPEQKVEQPKPEEKQVQAEQKSPEAKPAVAADKRSQWQKDRDAADELSRIVRADEAEQQKEYAAWAKKQAVENAIIRKGGGKLFEYEKGNSIAYVNEAVRDENGNIVKDENGRALYQKVPLFEGFKKRAAAIYGTSEEENRSFFGRLFRRKASKDPVPVIYVLFERPLTMQEFLADVRSSSGKATAPVAIGATLGDAREARAAYIVDKMERDRRAIDHKNAQIAADEAKKGKKGTLSRGLKAERPNHYRQLPVKEVQKSEAPNQVRQNAQGRGIPPEVVEAMRRGDLAIGQTVPLPAAKTPPVFATVLKQG